MRLNCRRALAAVLVIGAVSTGRVTTRAAAPANDDATIVHVLNRLGFGPTPASVQQVRKVGVQRYIDQQLHPERIDDAALAARLAPLATLNRSTRELADEYFLPAMRERRERQRQAAQNQQATGEATPADQRPSPAMTELSRAQRAVIGDLSQQRVLRAVYSERQLEEVMVEFWMNHFNVFVGKGQVRLYLTEYERDAIRPRVFGRFRDLLGATAESPAMLFYLDNWQSAAPAGAPTAAAADRPGMTPRPRAARRPGAVPQPFPAPDTIGQMPDAGHPQPNQGRRRGLNENYARELMELHTLGVDGGYTQKDVQEVARAFTGWTIANPAQGGTFRFEPRIHDDGEKVVLGRRIPAGGGKRDGDTVLDLLARHPSTARFIATKLARRFVSDEPPPSLIARAADRFTATEGNIREVVRVVVTSPEFYASARAKTKTPFEFVASAVRATGLDVTNPLPLVASLRDLGMPIYGAQPPTGYADKADAWVNSGALLARMNFAVALTGGQMRGLGAGAPYREARPADVMQALFSSALANQVSEATANTVARASTGAQAAALTLGSPEFQKR